MDNIFKIRVLLYVTGFLLFSQPDSLLAQEETATTRQGWSFWFFNYDFTPRLMFQGDFGYRQEFPYHNWRRTHLRGGLRWSAGSLVDLTGGISTWYTVQKSLSNSIELRPWQGIRVHWPNLGRFYFDHYARMEERFNYATEEREVWDFALRSRYRLNLLIPINRPGITDNTLFARINAEVFMDLGKGFEERYVENLRFSAGLGYRFNPKWRFELSYAADQSSAFTREGFKVNSHIFQVRIRTYIQKNA